jgi:hypothetical protein
MNEAESRLGRDAKHGENLMEPFADRWTELSSEVLALYTASSHISALTLEI